MISQQNRLINQLQGCVYVDSKDNTAFRINMDNVLKIFVQHDFILPHRQYEDKVQEVLDSLVDKKKLILDSSTKFRIATILLNVASQMSLTPEDLKKEKIKLDKKLRQQA